MLKRVCVFVWLLAAVACGGGNSTAASPSTTPAATRIIGVSGNLAFGNVPVGNMATAILTISNSGNATLSVVGLAVPSDFAASWTSGPIAAGASQAVTIQFAPTLTQIYSVTLPVLGDNTSGANTIAMSGTGTPGTGTPGTGTPAPKPIPPRVRIGATCADGWPSSATGSGACSDHGGVRCWTYSDGTCTNP